MSNAMEIRYMEWIIKRVAKLSLASRKWIMQRLVAVECGDVPVSDYLFIPKP